MSELHPRVKGFRFQSHLGLRRSQEELKNTLSANQPAASVPAPSTPSDTDEPLPIEVVLQQPVVDSSLDTPQTTMSQAAAAGPNGASSSGPKKLTMYASDEFDEYSSSFEDEVVVVADEDLAQEEKGNHVEDDVAKRIENLKSHLDSQGHDVDHVHQELSGEPAAELDNLAFKGDSSDDYDPQQDLGNSQIHSPVRQQVATRAVEFDFDNMDVFEESDASAESVPEVALEVETEDEDEVAVAAEVAEVAEELQPATRALDLTGLAVEPAASDSEPEVVDSEAEAEAKTANGSNNQGSYSDSEEGGPEADTMVLESPRRKLPKQVAFAPFPSPRQLERKSPPQRKTQPQGQPAVEFAAPAVISNINSAPYRAKTFALLSLPHEGWLTDCENIIQINMALELVEAYPEDALLKRFQKCQQTRGTANYSEHLSTSLLAVTFHKYSGVVTEQWGALKLLEKHSLPTYVDVGLRLNAVGAFEYSRNILSQAVGYYPNELLPLKLLLQAHRNDKSEGFLARWKRGIELLHDVSTPLDSELYIMRAELQEYLWEYEPSDESMLEHALQDYLRSVTSTAAAAADEDEDEFDQEGKESRVASTAAAAAKQHEDEEEDGFRVCPENGFGYGIVCAILLYVELYDVARKKKHPLRAKQQQTAIHELLDHLLAALQSYLHVEGRERYLLMLNDEAHATPQERHLFMNLLFASYGSGLQSALEVKELSVSLRLVKGRGNKRDLERLAKILSFSGLPLPSTEVPKTWNHVWQSLSIVFNQDDFQHSFKLSKSVLQAQTRGKLGLCLAGHGTKACFINLGILARLAECDMLRSVEAISCVSGGALVGSMYFMLLKELLEEKKDVEISQQDYIDLVKALIHHFYKGSKRTVEARSHGNPLENLLFEFWPQSWIPTGKTSRSTALADELHRGFFGPCAGQPEEVAFTQSFPDKSTIRMQDMVITPRDWAEISGVWPDEGALRYNPLKGNWRRSAKVPSLHLNTCNVVTGHLFTFTPLGCGEMVEENVRSLDTNSTIPFREWVDIHSQPSGCCSVNTDLANISLAEVVAIATSQVGEVEPFSIRNVYENDQIPQLVDASLVDTCGLRTLSIDTDIEVFICADANGTMKDSLRTTGKVKTVRRYLDICMDQLYEANVSGIDKKILSNSIKRAAYLHPNQFVGSLTASGTGANVTMDESQLNMSVNLQDKSSQTKRVSKQLLIEAVTSVRTNLDSFTEIEASTFMCLGYDLACERFLVLVDQLDSEVSTGRPVKGTGYLLDYTDEDEEAEDERSTLDLTDDVDRKIAELLEEQTKFEKKLAKQHSSAAAASTLPMLTSGGDSFVLTPFAALGSDLRWAEFNVNAPQLKHWQFWPVMRLVKATPSVTTTETAGEDNGNDQAAPVNAGVVHLQKILQHAEHDTALVRSALGSLPVLIVLIVLALFFICLILGLTIAEADDKYYSHEQCEHTCWRESSLYYLFAIIFVLFLFSNPAVLTRLLMAFIIRPIAAFCDVHIFSNVLFHSGTQNKALLEYYNGQLPVSATLKHVRSLNALDATAHAESEEIADQFVQSPAEEPSLYSDPGLQRSSFFYRIHTTRHGN